MFIGILHPYTLKMKILAYARVLGDEPETRYLKPETRNASTRHSLQSGVFKNVCAHIIFKYFNRNSGLKVNF